MDEDVRTLWCGNLSDKVTEDILYELFMQSGPVQKVSIPKDRDGKQRSYGFITFKHAVSVPYALKLFDGTGLFDRPLSMKTRNNIELPTQSYVTNSLRPDPIQAMGNVFNMQNQLMLASLIPEINLRLLTRPDSLMYQSHMQPWVPVQDDKRNQRSHPYQREREHTRNDYRDQNNRRDRYPSHRSNESPRSTDHRSHRRNYR